MCRQRCINTFAPAVDVPLSLTLYLWIASAREKKKARARAFVVRYKHQERIVRLTQRQFVGEINAKENKIETGAINKEKAKSERRRKKKSAKGGGRRPAMRSQPVNPFQYLLTNFFGSTDRRIDGLTTACQRSSPYFAFRSRYSAYFLLTKGGENHIFWKETNKRACGKASGHTEDVVA